MRLNRFFQVGLLLIPSIAYADGGERYHFNASVSLAPMGSTCGAGGTAWFASYCFALVNPVEIVESPINKADLPTPDTGRTYRFVVTEMFPPEKRCQDYGRALYHDGRCYAVNQMVDITPR